MSAPWWHPEANPMADIRAAMRAAEQEYEAGFGAPPPELPDPVVIAAPRFREALLWAREHELAQHRWRWVQSPHELLGLAGGTVVLVNSARLLGDPGEWLGTVQVLGLTGTVVRTGST